MYLAKGLVRFQVCVGSQCGHVVSSRNSIPTTQVQLPPEETTEKMSRLKKCAFNELDWQGVP